MAVVAGEETILEEFRETRRRTRDLVSTLRYDDYMVQTAEYTSPPKWHLGHVSWIYEAIMSKMEKEYAFYSDEWSEYLNSYYQQFGLPGEKGRRGEWSRPSLDEIMRYFSDIDERVEEFVKRGSGYERVRMTTLGIHHECQHQELLLYDLQHMLAEGYEPFKRSDPPRPAVLTRASVKIRGGLYNVGYNGDGFCYDIELPEHAAYLEDYEIDAVPVTNGEYLKFMEDGGYEDYTNWLSDGWDRVKRKGWNAPMYWEKVDGEWQTRDFTGRRKINLREPVSHVSFYEADAYCRWAGKRLPTEAEWEKAALWDEEKGCKRAFPWGDTPPSPRMANLLESYIWRPAEAGSYPDGESPSGCRQMIGDIWEWTASEFVGYPGFRSGFDEYNDKWFSGQKVLRGGSFATPSISIRGSYRNFFRMDERWLFSGFRCAAYT